MGVITLIKILIQLCKKGSIVQLGFNGGSNKIWNFWSKDLEHDLRLGLKLT
jgi:hypothetical protein